MPQMQNTPGDGIVRSIRKPVQRWMPGVRRQQLGAAMRIAAAAGTGFLLCFADMMGVPSGVYAAWIVALAACGEDILWPLCGAVLSVPMRLIWGIEPRWETLAVLLLLLSSGRVVHRRAAWRISAWTAVSLVPCLLTALGGTAEKAILAAGTVITGVLAAPVMVRGVQLLTAGTSITSLEERVAVAYPAVLLLCGGARLALFGVNVGMLGAGMMTLCTAAYLGAGAGCITGLMSGLALALQGLPVTLSVCLAMGGFMAGVAQLREKRWITCAGFLASGLLAMFMSGTAAGYAAGMIAAAAAVLLLPMDAERVLQTQFGRFRWEKSDADACCSQMLARWERTMEEMVSAVPMPVEANVPEDGWKERLCAGCPDEEACTVMDEERGKCSAAAAAAAFEGSEAQWDAALEGLRGLGCGRLYHLRERMDHMRREALEARRQWQKSVYQRELLVTHLTAMAGTARRFALLSTGGTWWDAANARALRQAAAERALPATLLYARRVDGHAQAAWELHVSDASLPEKILSLASTVLDMPLEIAFREEGRIFLGEKPVYCAETGAATCGMIPGEAANGDAYRLSVLPDGRLLAILADGMGHGERARSESTQTVAMMHLCMEAGYTRQQTLSAVNGMMLCASPGDVFATVDMATVDLWSGRATIDKLGAAASWLSRGDTLTPLKGEALPLGILEHVVTGSVQLRLKEGDTLLLMSDGVEDAFESELALETAIRTALLEDTSQRIANRLMSLAELARGGRADDRTVLVIRLGRSERNVN